MRRFAIVLLVLLLLALVVDRGAAYAAASMAGTALRDDLHLNEKPGVAVHGWPFLTQVAAGRYDDIQITAHGVDVSELPGLSVDVRLLGAHIPAGDVIHRRLDAVPVDRVQGSV